MDAAFEIAGPHRAEHLVALRKPGDPATHGDDDAGEVRATHPRGRCAETLPEPQDVGNAASSDPVRSVHGSRVHADEDFAFTRRRQQHLARHEDLFRLAVGVLRDGLHPAGRRGWSACCRCERRCMCGAGATDDPLGNRQVHHPREAHHDRARRLPGARVDEDEPGNVRQHLRARSQADGVRADHPVAVRLEASAKKRTHPEQHRDQHGAAKDDALDEDAEPVARRPRIADGHPQTRDRHRQSGRHQRAAGDAMPTRMPAPKRGRELKRAEQAEHDGWTDVQERRNRRRKEARVVVGHDRARGDLCHARAA